VKKNTTLYFVSNCAFFIFSEADLLQRERYCHIGAEKTAFFVRYYFPC